MATPRPTQVTIAGWVVITGSVVAVVMAFSEVAQLHSLSTRQEIEKYVSGSHGASIGLGVQDVLTILRVASTVSAACAAATGILGWYVLRRSRGSRLALTVIAVPLFASGLLSGGVAAAVVSAAAAMLWLQPARAWFDGVELPRRTTPTVPRPPAARPPVWPAPPSSYDRDALLHLPPPSAPPFGAPPFGAPPFGAAPPSAPPAYRVAPARPRPGAVVWTCVITWGVAAFALLIFGSALVSMLTDTQRVLDQAHRQNPDLAAQGISDTTLRVALYATTAVGTVWALAAAGLAVLAWRRVRWAATGLVLATVLVGGLGLLLLRGEVRSWYAVRR